MIYAKYKPKNLIQINNITFIVAILQSWGGGAGKKAIQGNLYNK